MKKTLILCSLLLLLLVGCSQKEKNDNEYKGEYGTYEIMDTRLIEDNGRLREEYAELQWKIKYTNTSSEVRIPIDSIELDMILENETDVELNKIPFERMRIVEARTEEQKLMNNGWLNIKTGATVEIMVRATIEKKMLDALYLRNRNEQGQNGEQFEKKIKIEDSDKVGAKADVTIPDEPLIVNVRANEDSWEFIYPDEIVTSNELVVPTNEKVYFNLIPSDSGHSFWIPAVGGRMDTNPNNVNEFWLEFDPKDAIESDGIFYGKCAEHGDEADMNFNVKAIPRAEFNQWIEEMG